MKNNNILNLLIGRGYTRLFAAEDGGGGGVGGDGNDAPAGDTNDEGVKDGGEQGGDDGKSGNPVLGGSEPGDKPDGTGKADGDASEGKPKDEGQTEIDAKMAEVPEDGKYDVFAELPEGLEITDEDKAFWDEQFAGAKVSRGEAQRIRDFAIADRQRQAEAAQKEIETLQETHLAAAKKDKEIGGANWDASIDLANRALTALRGGVRQQLDSEGKPMTDKDGKPIGVPPSALETMILATGNGNNPEMIRELRRIGELFKEDTFDAGKPVGAPVSSEKSWYGETTPDKKRG